MTSTAARVSDRDASIGARLEDAGQRYTSQRRTIVEAIAGAGRPVTTPEVLSRCGHRLSQSSVYRNLAVLADAGVLRRLPGGDFDLFELDEALSGHHHHHLHCTSCSVVIDVPAGSRLEHAVAAEVEALAADLGFAVEGHSVDLYGRCADCSAQT
jgi:Fur family transcriptional regulator, ferric uptake regulator